MTESLDKVRAATKRLKVFPLPSVVLLPGAAVPLHIFEPRYREMMKDALATDGLVAMAQVMPGQEAQLAGRPALEEMLCVGHIGLNEKLEDGRYNLVLVGVARAMLKREHQTKLLYREVEAQLIEDEVLEPEEDEPLRRAVVELVARLPTQVGQRVVQVASRVSGGALADVVASTFMNDPVERFEVLRETDVRQRIELVTQSLLMVVEQMKPRKPEGLMN